MVRISNWRAFSTSHTYDGTFCKSSEQLVTVNYFYKKVPSSPKYIFHKNNQYLKQLLTIQQTVNSAVYLNFHRGSCTQMFFKTSVFKNFAIFIGKHLCWGILFNKVADLEACNFIKRDSDTGVFLWMLRNI